MHDMPRPPFALRAAVVRARVDLVALIGKVITLSRGKAPRGKCPFHGSKSDSFSVNARDGYAHCFGCQWHGDAIKFLVDHEGMTPVAALEQLEAANGIEAVAFGSGAAVQRARNPTTKPIYDDGGEDRVDAIALGRFIWAQAGQFRGSRAERYLLARGVPKAMLTAERIGDLRFCAAAPVVPWRVSEDPCAVPHAPALVAMMRKREVLESGAIEWRPCGVHVTWLNPDGTGKMVRKRRDGSEYPARKMLGAAGGAAVVLGGLEALTVTNPPLFVGEGLETILCGMSVCEAASDAIGIAVLSLDNLQGGEILWKRGVRALFDVRGDPERPPVCFAHGAAVTGLIDADMKPLRGVRGAGLAMVETRGGPIVNRTLTTAERAHICGTLFVQAWRRAGCQRVSAVRPPMGMDFNDAVMREGVIG
jgi:DNA primase